jgi:hypothetical protein
LIFFFQFLQEGKVPREVPEKKKKKLVMNVAPCTLINGCLYNIGHGDVLRMCILEHEMEIVIDESHSCPIGGHYHVDTTTRNFASKNLVAHVEQIFWSKNQ